MAIELSELVAMRDELVRSRAKGVLTVQCGEERVQYKSDAEMASAIADLDRRIAHSTRRPIAKVRFSASRGM